MGIPGASNVCQVCGEHPYWRILRVGDVVVTWACTLHLHDVCLDLQRARGGTELVITEHAA